MLGVIIIAMFFGIGFASMPEERKVNPVAIVTRIYW
jgi:Na+/H+-dicarboxylate symporter